MLYAGRGSGASCIQIDPATFAYTGLQTRDSSGGSIPAIDFAMGPNGFGYAVRGTGSLYEVDASLVYTGRQLSGFGNLVSIQFGPDGMLYVGRESATAIRVDPVTLSYAGVQTNGFGSGINGMDISVGADGHAWVVRSTDRGYRVDSALQFFNGDPQTPIGFGDLVKVQIVNSLAPDSCTEVWARGYGLEGDMNKDCFVEWADFGIFASQWQQCVGPNTSGCDAPWVN